MKYLMMVKHAENIRTQDVPPALNEAMGKFVEESMKSGILKDTAGLQATSKGFRVRSAGGKLHVTDGPFTEAKEVVGGYAILEVKSEAHAREVAGKFMELHRRHWPEFEFECEARPLEA